MAFNSFTFLLFFVLVYGLFLMLPTWAAKKWLLLAASYVFYSAWNPPYVGLLFLSTTLDWWLARRLGGTENPSLRRMLLLLSLVGNLGLLSYFKYGNFLLENFSVLLQAFGVAYRPIESRIILPIGISFYTFASLSYMIDVYRRDIKADWRFTDYALFVSFFPHLVAGPILRASALLPQIASQRQLTPNQVGWGLCLIIMGLFGKVVLADGIFAPIVDEFYVSPSKSGAVGAWLAIFCFSGQIYYDFNGYSLCAIGLAMCFGFSFPDNFLHPYAARGFSDFWRRWHVSLSSWLRDYLYIPLGGNRHGESRTQVNLLLTMLIGGLWHGASWMFVFWGGLHGIYLVLEKTIRRLWPNSFFPSSTRYGLIEVLTFVTVTLTWIPFRAATPDEAALVLASLFRLELLPTLDLIKFLGVVAIFYTVRWHFALRDSSIEDLFPKLGLIPQICATTLCLIGLFLFSGGDQRAFIYFQF